MNIAKRGKSWLKNPISLEVKTPFGGVTLPSVQGRRHYQPEPFSVCFWHGSIIVAEQRLRVVVTGNLAQTVNSQAGQSSAI
jgi:hypothetical protein